MRVNFVGIFNLLFIVVFYLWKMFKIIVIYNILYMLLDRDLINFFFILYLKYNWVVIMYDDVISFESLDLILVSKWGNNRVINFFVIFGIIFKILIIVEV